MSFFFRFAEPPVRRVIRQIANDPLTASPL
jgi:hypothetical protein